MATVVSALVLMAAGTALAQTPAHASNPPPPIRKTAGTWAAPIDRSPLSSDLDVSVFGPHAFSIRRVELTIQPSGDGVITVTRSVVDAKGRTVPGSVSIDNAHLQIRWPEAAAPAPGTRQDLMVAVQSAERRYPGSQIDRMALNGLALKLSTMDPSGERLDVRFDPPGGTDSFGAALMRRSETHHR